MDQLLLFAQFSEDSHGFASTGRIVFMVAVAVVGLLISVVVLAWRKTQFGHIERMKAMELGQPPQPSHGPLACYCGLIGAGVPIGTFLITWLASRSGETPHDLWLAPSLVSVVALIGVSIVAGVGFGRSNVSADSRPKAKPAPDSDAVDFAGRFHRH